MRNDKVSGWMKILGALGVIYIVSRIDSIPDVIPILGWLDNIGVAAQLVGFVPRELAKLSELE